MTVNETNVIKKNRPLMSLSLKYKKNFTNIFHHISPSLFEFEILTLYLQAPTY